MHIMRVRAADENDSAAVAGLLGQLGYETPIDAALRRIESLLRSEDRALYLAEIEGSLVGAIEVAIMQAIEHDPRAEIRALVVDGSHRGRGIGATLVRAAEEWARGRRVATMRVRSNISRERTRVFYEKHGYRVIKTSLVFDKDL